MYLDLPYYPTTSTQCNSFNLKQIFMKFGINIQREIQTKKENILFNYFYHAIIILNRNISGENMFKAEQWRGYGGASSYTGVRFYT